MHPQPKVTPVRDAQPFFGLWPWSKGPQWRLDEEYSFDLEFDGIVFTYTIPAGYLFDGQSVPGLLHGFPFHYGPAGVGFRAALVHDFLCDLLNGGSEWLREKLQPYPPVPPAQVVHDTYKRLQLEDGQRASKVALTHKAVSWFGPKGKLRFW